MLRGREVVIVDAVGTAIERGHPENGASRAVHPNELLGACFTALIDRSGPDSRRVGDVIAGCVTPRGERAINIARNAWLQAGLPIDVPATTVDSQCESGQQAVAFAVALIASGTVDVAIASPSGVLAHGCSLHCCMSLSDRIQERGVVAMCCRGGLGTGILIQAL